MGFWQDEMPGWFGVVPSAARGGTYITLSFFSTHASAYAALAHAPGTPLPRLGQLSRVTRTPNRFSQGSIIVFGYRGGTTSHLVLLLRNFRSGNRIAEFAPPRASRTSVQRGTNPSLGTSAPCAAPLAQPPLLNER